MNLYHVITNYQLLNAIVLAQLNEDVNIIVCSEWIRQKVPDVTLLNNFFDQVIEMNANYRFTHTFEDSKKYFEEQLGDLTKYSSIYVWGAQFSLGVMLCELKIPFIYCEEAAGLLSRPEVLYEIEKNFKFKSDFIAYEKSLGLYDGSTKYAIRHLCNTKAQRNSFVSNNKIIDFDIVDNLSALPAYKRQKIQEFFGVNQTVHIPPNSTIILTEHFANLYVLTFEGQVLLYQLLIDFFFSNKVIVFKPHPDDVLYYQQLFPASYIIRDKFPAEFMPFLLSNEPECVATVSSTSIYNLRGHYNSIFELNKLFLDDIEVVFRYYIAVRIAEQLQKKIVCIGANTLLCSHLAEQPITELIVQDISDVEKSSAILIDNIADESEATRKQIRNLMVNLDESSLIIFINSKGDYCWYSHDSKDLWNDVKPYIVSKKTIRENDEDRYVSLEDEIVYLYCKNKELMTMADSIELKKGLPHTGITIETSKLDSKDERIKMLEGILAATERRLLYYIEKEKAGK